MRNLGLWIEEKSQQSVPSQSTIKALDIKDRKRQKEHEDIYNSIWAPKKNLLEQEKERKTQYYLTIWDLPEKLDAKVIKKYLSFFGTASIIAWQHGRKSKAAYIEVETDSKRKEEALKNSWSVYLDKGKTYRTTPGRFNLEELESRNKYKLVIKNLPNHAIDTLLL